MAPNGILASAVETQGLSFRCKEGGVMYWAILALGIVALVVGYAAGVKAGRPWGVPLVVLAALVIIGLVVTQAFGSGRETAVKGSIEDNEYARARALGEALASEVPADCRVFFFSEPGPPHIIGQTRNAWGKGLSEGLASEQWTDMGAGVPRGIDAAAFSEALAGVAEEVDLVLFSGRVPADLEEMAMYYSDSPPKVGMYWARFEPALARQWIEKDLVQAVLAKVDDELTLFTATNLPDVP